MVTYRCQNSYESIFTAIYRVYEEHRQNEDVYLALDEELRLFSEDIPVVVDWERSRKVVNTIVRRFGIEDYEALCYALATPEADKAQAVYETIRQGLKGARQGHLFDNLSDKGVLRTFELSRAASRECCHLRGFARFEELENGILCAKISPKNDLLPFLMPHFADRFPNENFMIADMARGKIGIHPAGEEWYLLSDKELPEAYIELSAEEIKYQMLFKRFCTAIAIEERKNLELQRGLLPLYFRKHMTEFS